MALLRFVFLGLLSVTSARVCRSSFVLAGDSTVTDTAGWGGAFCSETLRPGVRCQNFADSGETTSSFRSNGFWAQTLNATKAAAKPCYVPIQFGHNDQKIANYSETYIANLIQMSKDVRANGGIPIFVTPLSRRNYSGGKIVDILEPWAAYMRFAANASNTHYVELLQTSITYLNAIGQTAAWRLNWGENGTTGTDKTHLNSKGGTVFARMVADLINGAGIARPNPFNTNATLSAQIKAGNATF